MANTVIIDDGIEIYLDRIYVYADEYISTLPDPNRLYNINGNTFTGMIKYINRHMGFNKAMYADIGLLDNIWSIYTDLCYKYNQNPTIEEYAMLIGISRDVIYDWLNGTVRQYIYRDSDGNIISDFFTWRNHHRNEKYTQEPSSIRSNTIKKWQEECKLGRYKSAAAGNVGGIFLCKAVDGMVETAPVQMQNTSQARSIEEIQQEYLPDKGGRSVVAQLPEADFTVDE